MSTITKEEEEEVKVEDILSYPYALIIHNDDYNSFDHVIDSLIKICKHTYEQASQIAHLVHYTGKCDAKRGDKPTIEKMHSKLKSLGLTTSMEEL